MVDGDARTVFYLIIPGTRKNKSQVPSGEKKAKKEKQQTGIGLLLLHLLVPKKLLRLKLDKGSRGFGHPY